MKKKYISPETETIEFNTNRHILAASYTEIGDTTDRFDAKKMDSLFDDDKEEQVVQGIGKLPYLAPYTIQTERNLAQILTLLYLSGFAPDLFLEV